jgi:hypothetical protein
MTFWFVFHCILCAHFGGLLYRTRFIGLADSPTESKLRFREEFGPSSTAFGTVSADRLPEPAIDPDLDLGAKPPGEERLLTLLTSRGCTRGLA